MAMSCNCTFAVYPMPHVDHDGVCSRSTIHLKIGGHMNLWRWHTVRVYTRLEDIRNCSPVNVGDWDNGVYTCTRYAMDREYGDTRMAKSGWNGIHNNDGRMYGEILYEQYTSPPSDDRVYSLTKCR